MFKKLSALFAAFAIIAMPAVASAHVVVKPAEVLTGAFQTFTMGVPNEKDANVTKIVLDIPAGLQYVTPTAKDGWTITTDKTGDGEDAVVKSITWDGGTIGVGFRDDFTFSGKAPDNATQLNWKAYQTYDNGVTVAWDQKPDPKAGDDDSKPVGPYSITSVVKTASTAAASTNNSDKDSADNTARYLSIAALVVAVVAFAIASKPKKA